MPGCRRASPGRPHRTAGADGGPSSPPSAARRTAWRASPTRTPSRPPHWRTAGWSSRSPTATVIAVTSAAPGARGWRCRSPAWPPATRPAGLPGPGQEEEELRSVLVPGIVARWRDAVLADVAAEPFTGQEDAVRRGDDVTIPYGATLLLAVGLGERLLLAQIGDGDILGIGPDGTAVLPVPGDPLLDGRHTTSLCSPRAAGSFRVAAAGLAGTPLLGVLLATDGYGNAQVARAWEAAVSADLAGLISAHPASWLASKLPEWAARCASLDGSGDDTTLALMLTPATAAFPEHGVSGP